MMCLVSFLPKGECKKHTHNEANYKLTWSDEFSADTIDMTKWKFDLGDGCPAVCGWGNDELEWYTDRSENAFIHEGILMIEARKESMGGKEFTSSRMKTQGKFSFKYGRIDVRAYLPSGKGIWPAIWMLGENITSVGWPACGEIDIMEYLGHDTHTVYGTGHWGKDLVSHRMKGDTLTIEGPGFHESWHVFSVDWDEDSITWLVDDLPYFTLPIESTWDHQPFKKPFFILLNVAVGGNWPGNPDESTTFPQLMKIDYVRVFSKT